MNNATHPRLFSETAPRLTNDPTGAATIGAVVIGRNEGARLAACLALLQGRAARLVYVDSGSTDDSVAMAERAGAVVVQLDTTVPFTAARARNAGLASLAQSTPPTFVQFVDGDCIVDAGWLDKACRFLVENPMVAVVSGRRREIHPAATVYNRLCDWEWDTPIGEARACGGDALMRTDAVLAAGGYRETLIAGEEPELCVRLRAQGWRIWRLDAEMTCHDAAMTRFGQWWRRSRRAGFAYAEGAALHGAPPERHWRAETRRALVWAFAPPLAMLALVTLTPAAPLVLLVYPLQVIRLAARGALQRASWERAFFTTLGKVPEAFGIVEYAFARLVGRRKTLIEYK